MIQDWLLRHAPGYDALPVAGREALASFVFLWSLLEGQALDANASPGKLVDHARLWGEFGHLPTPGVIAAVAYFKDRYFPDGAPNTQFDSLHFRPNDRRADVAAVLSGQVEDPIAQAAATLLIIYRLRNNLFHGVKWAAGLHDQQGNFEHANQVLIEAISFPAQADAG